MRSWSSVQPMAAIGPPSHANAPSDRPATVNVLTCTMQSIKLERDGAARSEAGDGLKFSPFVMQAHDRQNPQPKSMNVLRLRSMRALAHSKAIRRDSKFSWWRQECMA